MMIKTEGQRISTPEEVTAWLAGALCPCPCPAGSRDHDVELLVRATLYRLCPEAPDYYALNVVLLDATGLWRVPYDWWGRVTDAEAIAHVERAVAKLNEQAWREAMAGVETS